MIFIGTFYSPYEISEKKKIEKYHHAFQLITEAVSLVEAIKNFKLEIWDLRNGGAYTDLKEIHCFGIIEFKKPITGTHFLGILDTSCHFGESGLEPDLFPSEDISVAESHFFTPDTGRLKDPVDKKDYKPFIVFEET